MKKFDVILLLGFRLYDDGTADPTTIARVDKAAELWKQGIAPVIVSAGGRGFNEIHNKTQADVMAELLIERGVPNEAIIREDKSRTTVLNVECTQQLLGKKEFKGAVVTSGWHMKRALLICKKLGVIAKAFPAMEPHNKIWRARTRIDRIYTFEERVGWTSLSQRRPKWINPFRTYILKRDKAIVNEDFNRYNSNLRK